MALPQSNASSAPRLEAIEGFRAYLALWVVVCHAMWASGYLPETLSLLPRLLLEGPYAVGVFIVISAFVIFLLLDRTRMPAVPFLTRRFFRLYPLFITLFVVSIPVSIMDRWNIAHAGAYLAPRKISYLTRLMDSEWQNVHWHTALHAVMLNGVVPERLLENAPGAFLDPAWSVSLEWQFYLVAPLAFALAISGKLSRWMLLAAGCVVMLLLARVPILKVEYGAALPFHVGYFVGGGLSYVFYRWYKSRTRQGAPFLIGCGVALLFIALGGRDPLRFSPAALWAAFFGLILENRASWSWRLVSPLFTNPVAQLLGRVSYSIYLSHILVLAVFRFALLHYAPGLSRTAHFSILLATTVAGTIGVSMLLYRYVEEPGIRLGRLVAGGARRRVTAPSAARASSTRA